MQLRLLDVLLAYVKDQYNEFDYDVLWIKVFDWLKGGVLKICKLSAVNFL